MYLQLQYENESVLVIEPQKGDRLPSHQQQGSGG